MQLHNATRNSYPRPPMPQDVCQNTAAPLPPIPATLNACLEQLEKLSITLSALDARLSPVIRPEVCDSCEAPKRSEESHGMLATVEHIHDTLRKLQGRVEQMTSNLMI